MVFLNDLIDDRPIGEILFANVFDEMILAVSLDGYLAL